MVIDELTNNRLNKSWGSGFTGVASGHMLAQLKPVPGVPSLPGKNTSGQSVDFRVGWYTGDICVIYDNTVVAYLALKERDITVGVGSWTMHRVNSVAVNQEYRGQEIALRLYIALVTAGINLMTLGSHSLGAKKVWNNLAKSGQVSVWVTDMNSSKFYTASPASGTLRGVKRGKFFPVYGTQNSRELIATAAGSALDRAIIKASNDQGQRA